MSVCPTPPKAKKTDYSTVSKMTNSPKQPKMEMCAGGTTSTVGGPGNNSTTVTCCPNPGPAGPKGCALKWESAWEQGKTYNYESGDPCVTSIVTHNNVTYICKVTHSVDDTTTEPGVGDVWMEKWDVFMSSTGELRWVGTWADGKDYKKNDVILGPTTGHAFVCIQDHTSDSGNPFAGEPPSPTKMMKDSILDIFSDPPPPGPGSGGTSLYWEAMVDLGKWSSPQQVGFVDGLMDGVMDWWKDAPLWEKVLGIAAGIGLAYAGAKILGAMTKTGDEDPQGGGGSADSRYNGSPGYNGAFTQPTLPVVVASIMEYVGYAPSDFDVTSLEAKPVNFTIASSMNARSLLNQLALTYQFDVVPSGGKVKFVPKYQTIARHLTNDDLGFAVMDSSTSGPAPYTARRLQGIDLPRSITFTYYSAALDHNTFTQIAELHTYEDGQDVTIAVPFTLEDAEAMRIAQTTLVNSHIEQQEFTFTTDYHNIDLEPGDVITIPIGDGSSTAQVRIKELTETEDGLLEFRTARSDYNTQSYEYSGVTVAVPPSQPTNLPVSIGYSESIFVEVPAIDSTDGAPRLVALVTGFGKAGWPGANIYKSIDGGNTYALVASASAPSKWGMVANPTPAPVNGYYVWDDVTQISVTLKEGTLTNSTDIGVLNGTNWALVGEELIGFVNATLTGTNTYTLSRLLRGRKGTEVKMGSHLANELFLVIDGSAVEIDIPISELKQVVKYKTVTIGSSLDKVDAVDVQPVGLNALPWAPGNVKVTKNTNGDYLLTWVERPRLNNGLQDERELTHDTDWAGYGVTIFTDNTATAVKRSAVQVVNNYIYTKEMQIADFGSAQTSIKASVVQISQQLGGGYPIVVTG